MALARTNLVLGFRHLSCATRATLEHISLVPAYMVQMIVLFVFLEHIKQALDTLARNNAWHVLLVPIRLALAGLHLSAVCSVILARTRQVLHRRRSQAASHVWQVLTRPGRELQILEIACFVMLEHINLGLVCLPLVCAHFAMSERTKLVQVVILQATVCNVVLVCFNLDLELHTLVRDVALVNIRQAKARQHAIIARLGLFRLDMDLQITRTAALVLLAPTRQVKEWDLL